MIGRLQAPRLTLSSATSLAFCLSFCFGSVTFCAEHARRNAAALRAQMRKASSGPSPEALLSQLSGYGRAETRGLDGGRSEAARLLGKGSSPPPVFHEMRRGEGRGGSHLVCPLVSAGKTAPSKRCYLEKSAQFHHTMSTFQTDPSALPLSALPNVTCVGAESKKSRRFVRIDESSEHACFGDAGGKRGIRRKATRARELRAGRRHPEF